MLAINSNQYCVPTREENPETGLSWRMYDNKGANYLVSCNFTYTFVEGPFKASFTYNLASVKPTPRTLRVYGASALKDFVSKLSSNTNPDAFFPIGYLVDNTDNQRLKDEYEEWAITHPSESSFDWDLPD